MTREDAFELASKCIRGRMDGLSCQPDANDFVQWLYDNGYNIVKTDYDYPGDTRKAVNNG